MRKKSGGGAFLQPRFPAVLLACAAAVWGLSACQSGLSKEVRDLADPAVTFDRVLVDPDEHRGEVVLWGGVIVKIRNTTDGTYLEVIQYPLGAGDRPRPDKEPGGRFLVLREAFLDPAVYGIGREVTVVGEVAGKQIGMLDEIEYVYPLVLQRDLVLWKTRRPGPRFHFGIGATFVR